MFTSVPVHAPARTDHRQTTSIDPKILLPYGYGVQRGFGKQNLFPPDSLLYGGRPTKPRSRSQPPPFAAIIAQPIIPVPPAPRPRAGTRRSGYKEEELPAGWMVKFDTERNRPYYVNASTRKRQWEWPKAQEAKQQPAQPSQGPGKKRTPDVAAQPIQAQAKPANRKSEPNPSALTAIPDSTKPTVKHRSAVLASPPVGLGTNKTNPKEHDIPDFLRPGRKPAPADTIPPQTTSTPKLPEPKYLAQSRELDIFTVGRPLTTSPRKSVEIEKSPAAEVFSRYPTIVGEHSPPEFIPKPSIPADLAAELYLFHPPTRQTRSCSDPPLPTPTAEAGVSSPAIYRAYNPAGPSRSSMPPSAPYYNPKPYTNLRSSAPPTTIYKPYRSGQVSDATTTRTPPTSSPDLYDVVAATFTTNIDTELAQELPPRPFTPPQSSTQLPASPGDSPASSVCSASTVRGIPLRLEIPDTTSAIPPPVLAKELPPTDSIAPRTVAPRPLSVRINTDEALLAQPLPRGESPSTALTPENVEMLHSFFARNPASPKDETPNINIESYLQELEQMQKDPEHLKRPNSSASSMYPDSPAHVTQLIGQLRRNLSIRSECTTVATPITDSSPSQYTDHFDEVHPHAAGSYTELIGDLGDWLRFDGAS